MFCCSFTLCKTCPSCRGLHSLPFVSGNEWLHTITSIGSALRKSIYEIHLSTKATDTSFMARADAGTATRGRSRTAAGYNNSCDSAMVAATAAFYSSVRYSSFSNSAMVAVNAALSSGFIFSGFFMRYFCTLLTALRKARLASLSICLPSARRRSSA